jgi:translation initiation factor 2D
MAAVEPGVDTLSRDELLKAFLNKLSPYSAIVQPGKSPVIRSGGPPTIYIEVLSRMGNKVVTVVRGLEAYGYEGKEVARDFQKRFACSSSVSPITGQPQLREVVVQGNWVDELRTYLVHSCLVPSNLVESKLGKNVKPKRKT